MKKEETEKPKRIVRRKKKYPIEALYLVAGVAFFLGAFFVWQSTGSVRNNVMTLTERITTIEDVVRTVGTEVQTLSEAVLVGSTTREEQQRLFEEKLTLLSDDVSTQQSRLREVESDIDISGAINTWSPFVYALKCTFTDEEGTEHVDLGSATLEQRGGSVRVMTNKHVIEREETDVFEGCVLYKPDEEGEVDIDSDSFIKNESVDFAYTDMVRTLPAMSILQRCTARPAIGDPVLILGYPSIGAKETVTATEGIISGFDKDYYATSAKIERGNSGGAAIDIKRGCFLGLPTLVLFGKVESLARILPVIGL